MVVEPKCYVQEIATAVPEQCLDQAANIGLLKQGCADARSARMLERLARLTGIERRHLAVLKYQPPGREDEWLYRRAAVQPRGPGMESRTAAFRGLADPLVLRAVGQLSPEALRQTDTLVTVTCTHAGSPGLEQPILTGTPVPSTVDWWNLAFMGCSAALAGVRLVHAGSHSQRRALIVACELSSLHFQYTDQIDQMTANVLFADGAAAMTLSPEPSPVRVMGCRCVCVPAFASQMVWVAGDNGLQIQLAQELPDTLAAHLPAAVASFLAAFDTRIDAIDHWVVHPGGPQILDAVETSLELPDDALAMSRTVLRTHGNMSSPTVLFILKELLARNPRGRVLALAFGPGLTIEMVLLECGS
jgi:prepilin-type processing-associated H-X9-DG protein